MHDAVVLGRQRRAALHQSCCLGRADALLDVTPPPPRTTHQHSSRRTHDAGSRAVGVRCERLTPADEQARRARCRGAGSDHFAHVMFPIYLRDMNTLTPAAAIRATPERAFVHTAKLPGSPTAARKAASRAVAESVRLPQRPG